MAGLVTSVARGFLAGLFAVFLTGAALAETFDFDAKQMVEKINKQLKEDGGDTITGCKKVPGNNICTFTDTVFQKSVVGFKKLNLVNGRFALKEDLSYKEENGKIAMLVLTGSRADPMNLFHFGGQLASIILALQPSMSHDDVTKEVMALGIMRGDSDPTIGKPKIDIIDAAQIVCSSRNSHVSTAVSCAFIPRS